MEEPMKKILGIALLALSLSSGAVDGDGKYRAVGNATCAKFIEWRKENSSQRVQMVAWMAGYITSYNRWNDDTYQILGSGDLESVELWMVKYCNDNPMSSTAHGIESLMLELRPKRLKVQPK